MDICDILDICGLYLLLRLRQAMIVSNSLKDFTNNVFLISILIVNACFILLN